MAAVQAAQVMTVAIPLAGYLARGDSGAGSIVAALLFLIPVLIVQERAVFRPATVDCNEHHLLLNAFAQMTTQRENVEQLFFNDGAGVVFRDVESVSLAGTGLSDRRQQNFRSALKGSFRKTGTHVSLQGFSMDEVESLRERPGMAPPKPGSEVHIPEQYHRSLIERTPVVWILPLLIGLNVGMFVVVAAASGSLLSITIPAMIARGADYGPLTLAGDWWPARFCTGGFFHLLCNLWGLHQGGRVMERLAGNFGFLVLYLFSGIAGSLLSIRWSPDAVCAGASGAVLASTGLLGPGTFGGVRTFLIELSGRSAAVRYRSLVSIC